MLFRSSILFTASGRSLVQFSHQSQPIHSLMLMHGEFSLCMFSTQSITWPTWRHFLFDLFTIKYPYPFTQCVFFSLLSLSLTLSLLLSSCLFSSLKSTLLSSANSSLLTAYLSALLPLSPALPCWPGWGSQACTGTASGSRSCTTRRTARSSRWPTPTRPS